MLRTSFELSPLLLRECSIGRGHRRGEKNMLRAVQRWIYNNGMISASRLVVLIGADEG